MIAPSHLDAILAIIARTALENATVGDLRAYVQTLEAGTEEHRDASRLLERCRDEVDDVFLAVALAEPEVCF